MKKAIKLFSLLMALILTMSLFTGCTQTNQDAGDEELETLTMTIAVPADLYENEDMQELLNTWKEDLEMFEEFELKVETIPTEEKEIKKFVRKVKSGKIAMVYAPNGEVADQMIEKGAVLKMRNMESTYTEVLKDVTDASLKLGMAEDAFNWMKPVVGTYQGLFYNTEIFEEHQIEVPTTWDGLLAAIGQLNAAGITPISAGFSDVGFNYMIDELVLSEGGTADHSYQPAFGYVSSWGRVAEDLKQLEAAGAFTADCYNVTFESALDSFLDGSDAMIVAPSTVFSGELDEDVMNVIGFPATPTGIRDKGDFVGDVTYGVYVSLKYYQKKNTRHADLLNNMLSNDYFGSPDFYNIVKKEGTFSAYASTYYGGEEENSLEKSVGKFLGKSADADYPIDRSLATFDNLVETYRKIMKGADMETELLAAAEVEIQAKAEAEKE